MKKITMIAVGGVLLLSTTGCSIIFQGNAIKNLENYSAKAGLTPLDCSNQDSDDDRYVSCDAKEKNGQTISLDCGYMPFAKGCKQVERFKGNYNQRR